MVQNGTKCVPIDNTFQNFHFIIKFELIKYKFSFKT